MAGIVERSAPRQRRATTNNQAQTTAPTAVTAERGFLAGVIDLLSPHEREALRLRHRDGLTDGAIAARLEVPVDMVQTLLARAEATLRAAQRAFIDALVESRR